MDKPRVRRASDISVPVSRQELERAAKTGGREAVRSCVVRGLDLSESFSNVMHIAAEWNNVEAIRALAESGWEVSHLNHRIWASRVTTPLHCAARFGNIKAIHALLDLGASIDMMDSLGYTPLHVAVESGFGMASRALIDRGADLNCSHEGISETPLHAAVRNNDLSTLTLLAEHGAQFDVGIEPRAGTLLCLAAALGHHEVMSELVRRGVDVNRPDVDRFELRQCAAPNNQKRTRQADLGAVDCPGDTAAHMDEEDGVDFIGFMASIRFKRLQRAASNSYPKAPVLYAAKHMHARSIHTLANLGADLGAVDYHGNSAVHIAARKATVIKPPSIGVLRELATAGADFNRRNNQGHTALFESCHNIGSNIDVIRALVEGGARCGSAGLGCEEVALPIEKVTNNAAIRQILQQEMVYERRRPFLSFLVSEQLISEYPPALRLRGCFPLMGVLPAEEEEMRRVLSDRDRHERERGPPQQPQPQPQESQGGAANGCIRRGGISNKVFGVRDLQREILNFL